MLIRRLHVGATHNGRGMNLEGGEHTTITEKSFSHERDSLGMNRERHRAENYGTRGERDHRRELGELNYKSGHSGKVSIEYLSQNLLFDPNASVLAMRDYVIGVK